VAKREFCASASIQETDKRFLELRDKLREPWGEVELKQKMKGF
jgi:hypothetical protein